MTQYEVSFYYTVYGTTKIEAKTIKQAELKVERRLSWSGLDDLKDINYNDRDFRADEAREVKQ